MSGDELPRMVTPPPGPVSRRLSNAAAAFEAPGVNALYGGRPNVFWREAAGSNVLDADGNLYVDLTAGFGVAAVGHRHPRVIEAVRQQSERLLHGLGDAMSHPARPALAERVAGLVPAAGEERQVYFAVSGSDAVEVALKTAVLAHTSPKRSSVVAFEPAYHGLTLGALQATSRPEFRRPFREHFHPRLHRLPFGGPATELRTLLEREPVAAVICEPIAGREGVLLPPDGWLSDVADACREHGAVFIVDEIFTGFGRTGRLFCVDHEGVRPDLVCCGKALGGGLPIAAVVGRRELLDAWRTAGEALHTATFVGHPLACAAAEATLDVLRDERLVERAGVLGAEAGERMARWEAFAAVREVRGRGLLWGVEMTSASTAAELSKRALGRGILLLAGGADGRVAQVVPPLVIRRRQLDAALGVLEDVLQELSSAEQP